MTPATTLALARAVYPQRDAKMCTQHPGNCDDVLIVRENLARDKWDLFDPVNDARQTLAVLCWLMAQPDCYGIEDGFVEIAGESFPHDNTPQSLAAAIFKAAGAVVESRT